MLVSVDPSTEHVYNFILVIIDQLTKELKYILINENLTAEGLVYLFNRYIVAEYGIPKEVIIDRENLFKSVY